MFVHLYVYSKLNAHYSAYSYVFQIDRDNHSSNATPFNFFVGHMLTLYFYDRGPKPFTLISITVHWIDSIQYSISQS